MCVAAKFKKLPRRVQRRNLPRRWLYMQAVCSEEVIAGSEEVSAGSEDVLVTAKVVSAAAGELAEAMRSVEHAAHDDGDISKVSEARSTHAFASGTYAPGCSRGVEGGRARAGAAGPRFFLSGLAAPTSRQCM